MRARWVPRRLPAPTFPIDRQMTAKALGFDRPAANSLDAVSDRDFALEYLSALSILAGPSLAPGAKRSSSG